MKPLSIADYLDHLGRAPTEKAPPGFAGALGAGRGCDSPLCTFGRLRGRNGELSFRGGAFSAGARPR